MNNEEIEITTVRSNGIARCYFNAHTPKEIFEQGLLKSIELNKLTNKMIDISCEIYTEFILRDRNIPTNIELLQMALFRLKNEDERNDRIST